MSELRPYSVDDFLESLSIRHLKGQRKYMNNLSKDIKSKIKKKLKELQLARIIRLAEEGLVKFLPSKSTNKFLPKKAKE